MPWMSLSMSALIFSLVYLPSFLSLFFFKKKKKLSSLSRHILHIYPFSLVAVWEQLGLYLALIVAQKNRRIKGTLCLVELVGPSNTRYKDLDGQMVGRSEGI